MYSLFFSSATTFCWPAHNALFVLRVLCKFLVENISEEELANQFECGGMSSLSHTQVYQFADTTMFSGERKRALQEEEEVSKLDLLLSSLVELLVDLHVR